MAGPKTIYLDHAAATPMDPAVLVAMRPYFSTKFYNPSASYDLSRKVANDIKVARATIAATVGAKASEIIFTAGGTEANNLALIGIAEKYPKAEIVSTLMEHESILEPLSYLKNQGHKINLVKPATDGVVDPFKVAHAVNDKTVLVSVMYANNELGSVQPLRLVAGELAKIRADRQKRGNQLPLYLHTDACQAGSYLPLQVHRLGVDLMTLNGGKIYGPKQSGVLFASGRVNIGPIIWGGGQERGLRSGTENVAGIIGFARALALAQNKRQAESRRLQALQKLFFELAKTQLPGAKVNGSRKFRLPNNVHLTFPGRDNERLLYELDSRGIQCGLGSACSALNVAPSHVLRAIGLTDAEARASLRFSMGRATLQADVLRTVKILATLVA